MGIKALIMEMDFLHLFFHKIVVILKSFTLFCANLRLDNNFKWLPK